jgi:hypothetical protein
MDGRQRSSVPEEEIKVLRIMEPLAHATRAAQEFHPEIIRAAPRSCSASRMAWPAVPIITISNDKLLNRLIILF